MGGGKLFCDSAVYIGDRTWFAFNCVCTDSDFHYIYHDGTVRNRLSPVVIGDNVWVANSCIVSKGTVLPPWSVLAARSLANKDYSDCGEGALLAGSPAKCVRTGCYRIYNADVEAAIKDYYEKNEAPYRMEEAEFRQLRTKGR